jgi:AcrR family transcriptional regulator
MKPQASRTRSAPKASRGTPSRIAAKPAPRHLPRGKKRSGKSARAPKAGAKPYHHGNLSAALVAATLELIEEQGPEQVSVREAARRAGVSSGAPFRHFPTRVALLTAVAAEALRRFEAEIERTLAEVPATDPLARFRALGIAFVRWALHNPTHFQVISSPHLTDWEHSDALNRDNGRIQALTAQCVADAQAQGQLPPGDPHLTVVTGRALVYGLARMAVDRHFPRWGVPDAEAEATAERAIDLFVAGLEARAGK